eukprot:6181005-Pleurochrysis_carterae.AAC.2
MSSLSKSFLGRASTKVRLWCPHAAETRSNGSALAGILSSQGVQQKCSVTDATAGDSSSGCAEKRRGSNEWRSAHAQPRARAARGARRGLAAMGVGAADAAQRAADASAD